MSYYSNEMKKVGVFSIPHHGSDDNWTKTFIDNGDLDNTICFASTHNYYKNRLTSIMMSDLRCHNISTLVVDENRFSEFEQFISIYNKFSREHIICTNKHKLIKIYI